MEGENGKREGRRGGALIWSLVNLVGEACEWFVGWDPTRVVGGSWRGGTGGVIEMPRKLSCVNDFQLYNLKTMTTLENACHLRWYPKPAPGKAQGEKRDETEIWRLPGKRSVVLVNDAPLVDGGVAMCG